MTVFTNPAGRPNRRAAWMIVVSSTVALQVVLSAALAADPPGRGASRSATPRPPAAVHADATSIHSATARTLEVTVERGGTRARIDTPDGPVWVKGARRAAPGTLPEPACLLCHADVENVTANMIENFELDCTFCHGGDPLATTIELAHVHPDGTVIYDQTVPPLDQDLAYQRFVNPSNLRVADDTCGLCHVGFPEVLRKSMMATAAGHYAGGLYQNNVVDTKTPIYGTFAVEDTDPDVPFEKGAVQSLLDLIIFGGGDPTLVSTHFAAVPSQACARCHLWSRGKGYRGASNADGVYRADGCAACHILYANDGLSQSADASIDHEETGHAIQHVVTKQIPVEQCVHCHHRGARIGLSFTGRAQMPPRLPSGPGVAGTTDVRFNSNYHYAVPDTNPQDIHGELGMHCIDCHRRLAIMGDGNIYGHMDQATKIECRTCHGTPSEPPTLLDNDGGFLDHVFDDGAGNYVLTSKVTGAEHPVPLTMNAVANNENAACAMNENHIKADGGLECYVCHAAWVPNCFGCHFERDERLDGLNLMTGEYEVGKVSTNNKIFESLRHFAIGPNSEGRVAPYLVACQPIADVTAPDGSKILDFVMPETTNGLSGLAHNPVNPHTTRGPGEVRTCAECHRSPPSLGFGSGNYSVARERVYTAGAAGVHVYERGADPGQPTPEESLPVIGEATAIAVRPNVVQGVADFLYVARGAQGVEIFDRRPGAPADPVGTIEDVNAIDVSVAARYLYVVDAGFGVRVYDNDDPAVTTPVGWVHAPGAVRAVPWGVHLFIAAGSQGLVIANITNHEVPFVETVVPDMDAVDVRLYAHFRHSDEFAVRAYVADPGYGVHVVDLLPDYRDARLVGGLPLVGAAGLDTYTRFVTASGAEPSREHDYLYVAAGAAGVFVFDITEPDAIVEVASVTDLGGAVVDVDVSSEMTPPGVDDYAVLANDVLGMQVLDVSDPQNPIALGTVADSTPASRVLVEVQQLDRFLDEQGGTLKENSHPFTGVLSRSDIVRILTASIYCGASCAFDLDGDGEVEIDDLVGVILDWGTDGSEYGGDVDGSGLVDMEDIIALLEAWGPCA